MSLRHLIILSMLFGFIVKVLPSRADQVDLTFESNIRPLFASKCGKCHSDTIQKGGLDLSSMSGLRHGGESGDAAIADTLQDSPLWTMIEGGDIR